ncbi:hypothetical protein AGMMS49574_08960 [Bacteroidia bacterium]|nr:hypothetical protein AGMMS49574_08960 [Bacteroidia bacterium]
MIVYEKDTSKSTFSHLYDLYQLGKVKDEDFPVFFENIFKFPENELNFIQQDIKPSFHYRYFSNYLFYDNNGLDVKTIVVEKDYTCLTFLEDYINYYAHCYTRYTKICRRIHLFKENFDEKQFQNMLYHGNESSYRKFWKSYLGCIVIKPLPKGIIGVTYLKTYDGDELRDRHYTAISPQIINLYGTSLELNTMPFIEQDSNVGSCASTALWMAFQKTSELFHTKKPSPSEITLLAGSDSYNTGKIFPSKGLELAQICRAIDNNGLHSELRYSENEITDRSWLQGFIYAYLKAEIPILLGIEIEDVGSHLITLNGYRFKFDTEKFSEEKFSYKSQYISKFYAHDDQTGPFSRLKFNKGTNEYFLRTSWWKANVDWSKSPQEIRNYFKEENNYYNCKPICLIVPLDRKIKIPYEEIIDKVKIIKYLFAVFFDTSFIWDIFLIKSNTYKEQVKKRVKQKKNLQKLLYTSLPQYIWVAQAYVDGYYEEPIFDFIFDSVEMPYDGKPFLSNIYSDSLKKCIDKSNVVQIQKLFSNNIENTAYKVFVETTEIMYELFRKKEKQDILVSEITTVLDQLNKNALEDTTSEITTAIANLSNKLNKINEDTVSIDRELDSNIVQIQSKADDPNQIMTDRGIL